MLMFPAAVLWVFSLLSLCKMWFIYLLYITKEVFLCEPQTCPCHFLCRFCLRQRRLQTKPSLLSPHCCLGCSSVCFNLDLVNSPFIPNTLTENTRDTQQHSRVLRRQTTTALPKNLVKGTNGAPFISLNQQLLGCGDGTDNTMEPSTNPAKALRTDQREELLRVDLKSGICVKCLEVQRRKHSYLQWRTLGQWWRQ